MGWVLGCNACNPTTTLCMPWSHPPASSVPPRGRSRDGLQRGTVQPGRATRAAYRPNRVGHAAHHATSATACLAPIAVWLCLPATTRPPLMKGRPWGARTCEAAAISATVVLGSPGACNASTSASPYSPCHARHTQSGTTTWTLWEPSTGGTGTAGVGADQMVAAVCMHVWLGCTTCCNRCPAATPALLPPRRVVVLVASLDHSMPRGPI